jgi:hypothetical protein
LARWNRQLLLRAAATVGSDETQRALDDRRPWYQYLEEILRVLPYWPRDRYLELAPKYWHATRGRLRPDELAGPLSAFEVPPPLGESVDVGATPIA